ncbi:MAG: HAMP domain-containing histidine kinase, partial [Selenomonadaceae bacterium]|nr:HAMP domain-containing histidine kinase [Selenomonadaceae bacterium]
LISHLTVFIVPLVITIFVILLSTIGLMLFARSGNHIYLENSSEFKRACEVIHQIIFRHAKEDEPNGDDELEYWLIGLLAPEKNYILFQVGDRTVYTYGNSSLATLGQKDFEEAKNTYNVFGKEFADINTFDNDYVYIEKQIVDNQTYWLYFVSEKASSNIDEPLELAIKRTTYFIMIFLMVFVFITSLLLSRYVLRHILLPLNELRNGAIKIRDGDLDLHLSHEPDDEIKPVMEAFNVMAQKLQESVIERKRQEDSRKELVASISHDLRTPITTIKAYIEGLIDNVANSPAKRDRYFKVIKKNVEELNNMIEELFMFSKISLGEKAIPLEPINLKNMLEFFVSENDYSWKKAGATVTLNAVENIVVMGSYLLLERTLSNIISNSIKYKPEYEIDCYIKLIGQNKIAILSIADNGSGVPEESLERLMEPFYRTDKARSRTEDGTGLGLSIALRAVELMKGAMRIENVQPHGLVVIIELPILQQEEKQS